MSIKETRASKLRKLMKENKTLYFPAVYDALSISMAESAGFEVVLISGSSISNESIGITDIGVLSYGEYRNILANMIHASTIPMIADVDTGFGGIPTILRMVEEYERMDIAGIMLEDQTFPKRCAYFNGLTVVPVEEMALRLKAAIEARTDPDFLIMARTDAACDESMGMDEALRRARIYHEMGADVVYISAPPTKEDIKRIKELDFPTAVCIIEGTITEDFTVRDYEEIGIKFAIFPQTLIRAMMYASKYVLTSLKETGRTSDYRHILCTQKERGEYTRLPKYVAFESRIRGNNDRSIADWDFE